jgi:hypothetical protein
MYERSFKSYGEPVTYKSNNGVSFDDNNLKYAIFQRYQEGDLIGTIDQDDRKLLLLFSDLDNLGIVPKRGDRVDRKGQLMTVQAVDDSTRSIQGVLMAYELRVRE